MRIVRALIILSIFSLNRLSAQELQVRYDTPEDGFALMRQHAAANRYAVAKNIGYRLLEENPEYFDVSLYLARIFGWEAAYDSAYSMLEQVLLAEPSLFEAHEVRVDLAYWENDWIKLEDYAGAALALYPDSSGIKKKYLLAKSQRGLTQEVTELLVSYSYDHFRKPYIRNWHMLSVGAIIPYKKGSLTPYLNGGYHSGVEGTSTDIQLNLDTYFHLGKTNYAMAGYGISPGGVVNYLPNHRAALELWQVLPAGFAISAGMRYFYWDQHFTFLTFSGEKYMGNYWFSLRNYLFFKEHGISGSYYLSARRYFADRFNYLNITVGYGTAPDEPLLVISDLDRLNALSFRTEFSKQVRYNLRLNLMAGYAYEEFDDQQFRNRFDMRIGLYIGLIR